MYESKARELLTLAFIANHESDTTTVTIHKSIVIRCIKDLGYTWFGRTQTWVCLDKMCLSYLRELNLPIVY